MPPDVIAPAWGPASPRMLREVLTPRPPEAAREGIPGCGPASALVALLQQQQAQGTSGGIQGLSAQLPYDADLHTGTWYQKA